MPTRLSAQWLCGNSCTWAHNLRLHIADAIEPKSAQQVKQGAYISILYIYIYIYIINACMTSKNDKVMHHLYSYFHNLITTVDSRG